MEKNQRGYYTQTRSPGNICKCGRPYVWGTLPDGKRVLLDPTLPVYAIVRINGVDAATRTDLAMAIHVVQPECQ